MKKFLYLFLVLISCSKISPEGKIETKDIDVPEYVNLNLVGKYRIFYVRSTKNFVEVETYPNIYKNLDISVKDKTLNIIENRETKGVDFYNITLYSKYNLEKIAITDSVEMNISSEIKAENISINLKKNAKFIGSIYSKKAEVEMHDHSLANFKGFTKNAVFKMSDTASIIAPYWFIDNLEITAKNGTYTEVNVKDSIKGNLMDTSKFLYYNDPIRAFKIEKTADVQNKKLD